MKDNDNDINYDYKNKKMIKKSSDKLDDIKIMKSFKDGIIFIGDKKGNFQLWY